MQKREGERELSIPVALMAFVFAAVVVAAAVHLWVAVVILAGLFDQLLMLNVLNDALK